MPIRNFAIGFLLAALLLVQHPAQAAMPVIAIGAVSELETLNGAKTPVVEVLSYYAGLDKGGGLFVWDAAAQTPADGCITFAPRGGVKGRWVRRLSGALDATMCGAWWDASHDDAPALTRAFSVASAQHVTLTFPGGTAKVCETVEAARAVIVHGQGMGTLNNSSPGPTRVDGTCIKNGWVFDIVTPNGTVNFEAPKYYDMDILTGQNNNPGGCIRWNREDGGYTDSPASQFYMLHPHAERIYCMMNGSQQTGLQCSKCFDGDFSQNNINFGKTAIDLEGSDAMCIGCAGPNRVSYSIDSLIRMVSHGTFGNMDRVVQNHILYPSDIHQKYNSFIFDATRSSTIESNHIEGVIPGVQSAIHVVGGFSHAVENNDIDVLSTGNRVEAAPHWLITEGPFVNFRAFNNGCGGCILGPALFRNQSVDFNHGGVRQIITHGGNAVNGDAGFPVTSVSPN